MSAFYLTLVRIISVILSVVFIPFSALTTGIEFFTGFSREGTIEANVTGLGAIFRSQGITTDGEYYYFSSKTTLIKTKLDGYTLVNANYSAIPEELSENCGIKHIGGISYYNGKIYAGMEDSKVWDYPIIGIFNADTLQLEKYYVADPELVTRGMPWVTVDPDTGFVYCMDHSKKPTKILVYETGEQLRLVKEVPLQSVPESIQGAEFLDGMMYASTNDATQAIYRINVETGAVEKFADRNLTGGEGEGMTFITRDGKTFLVAMDMGTIFINTFLREYPVEVDS